MIFKGSIKEIEQSFDVIYRSGKEPNPLDIMGLTTLIQIGIMKQQQRIADALDKIVAKDAPQPLVDPGHIVDPGHTHQVNFDQLYRLVSQQPNPMVRSAVSRSVY